jgi:signal transduction histidine kinase/CheY-like chemotaxis protein
MSRVLGDALAYPLALEVGGVAVWTWDVAEGSCCAWSPTAERLLGADAASLPTTMAASLALVHAEDVHGVRAELDAIAGGRGEERTIAFRLRHADCTLRWVRGAARLRPAGDDGSVATVVAALVDVTAEVTAAQHAQQRMELDALVHEVAARFISVPVHQVDKQIVAALGSVGHLLGAHRARFSLTEPGGPGFFRHLAWFASGFAGDGGLASLEDVPWLHERLRSGAVLAVESVDDLPDDATAERRLFAAADVESAMFAPLTIAGRVHALVSFSSTTPHRWPRELGAALRGLCEACVQALRRQGLEGALREAHAYLEHLVESGPVVLFRGPVDGSSLDYVSPNIGELLGREPAEIATSWLDLVHPDDAAGATTAQDRVRRDGSAAYEARFCHSDGRWVRLSVELRIDRDAGGAAIARTGYALDVTARRAAEERLAQAQKLEAVGHLAGGVAHDFNNLLQVIHGNAELLTDPGCLEEAGAILAAAEHGQRLVERLLTFSRQRPTDTAAVELNTVVEQVAAMLDRALGPSIAIARDLADGLPQVDVDHAQLEQALLNLIINARDAMPDGGTVTLRTAVADEGGLPDDAEGRFVTLSVSDTGHGMTDDVLGKLFEPFFTTKAPGKGTGLGLPAVYGAVTAVGGHIDVRSAVDRGTTFDLHLPQASTRGAVAATAPTVLPRGTGADVLVVEDQPEILRLVGSVLTTLGYRVVTAGGADDALGHVAAGAAVDVLVTDVTMAGMQGPALAAEIRARRPAVKVLYMSGYDVTRLQDEPDAEFLQKPFTLAELAGRIARLLA